MLRKPIIKSLLGGFMLILFAFSITPKKTLHDLLAHHKDSSFSINNSGTQQFSWLGFHCHCDNLVVESPFVDNYQPLELAVPVVYRLHYAEPAIHCAIVHQFYFKLRGPPSTITSRTSS